MPDQEPFSLEALESDQFQRYSTLARIIKAAQSAEGGPLSADRPIDMLDIGAGPSRLCEQVLGDAVRVTRADIDTFGQPDIVLLRPGEPLPFADGSHEVVTAIETLEHVPRPLRRMFLMECARVARHLVIISCPQNRPEVRAAEHRVSETFRAWNGYPHPFLREHEEFGLPAVEEVRAVLDEIGHPAILLDNSRLDRWEADLMIDQLLRTKQMGDQVAHDLYKIMNAREPGTPPDATFYRKFYLIVKSPELLPALAAIDDATQAAASPHDLPDALYQLSDLSAGFMCHKGLVWEGAATYYIGEIQRLDATKNELSVQLGSMGSQMSTLGDQVATLARACQDLQHAVLRLTDNGHVLNHRLAAVQEDSKKQVALISQFCQRTDLSHAAGASRDGAGGPSRSVVLWGSGAVVRLACRRPQETRSVTGWVMATRPTELRIASGDATAAIAVWPDSVREFRVNLRPAQPAGEVLVTASDPDITVMVGDLRVEQDEAKLLTRKNARRVIRRLVRVAARVPGVRALGRTPLGTRIKSKARRMLGGESPAAPAIPVAPPAPPPGPPVPDWKRWRIDHGQGRLARYRSPARPGMFSLLTTVWNTPPEFLEAMADSVFAQTYVGGYEWVLLDNGSADPATTRVLERLALRPEVKFLRVEENQGIIGGMRLCRDLATGRYLVPVDSDDYLFPDALEILGWTIEHRDFPALVYSDEDRIMGEEVYEPYLKPDWDPVLFVNSCFIAHLCAIDRAKAIALGAYTNTDANGSHDWDTFTKFLIAGYRPEHVPEVLYSWRMHPASCALDIHSKSYIYDSHRAVLGQFVASRPRPSRFRLELSPLFDGTPDWWIRRLRVEPRPIVSVILADDPGEVDTRALSRATAYPDHEVHTLSLNDPATGLLPIARRAAAAGALVHLVAHNVTPQGDEWAWESQGLMELFPDVVMVGGRVVSDADQIVAAGEYLGYGGICGCPDVGRPMTDPGYFAQMWKPRSVSAVPSLFAVIDPSFLVDLLTSEDADGMSLPYLGVWAAAHASRSGRRIAYSPFVIGRCAADPGWESLAREGERQRFLERHGDLLPDMRFLSPWLTREDDRPGYTPGDPRELQLRPRPHFSFQGRTASPVARA